MAAGYLFPLAANVAVFVQLAPAVLSVTPVVVYSVDHAIFVVIELIVMTQPFSLSVFS